MTRDVSAPIDWTEPDSFDLLCVLAIWESTGDDSELRALVRGGRVLSPTELMHVGAAYVHAVARRRARGRRVKITALVARAVAEAYELALADIQKKYALLSSPPHTTARDCAADKVCETAPFNKLAMTRGAVLRAVARNNSSK